MTVDGSVTSQRWGDAEGSAETARLHWLAPLVVRAHVNQRITGNPLEDWLSWSRRRWPVPPGGRVLVLGCGEGWVERALAADPAIGHIDACDLAAAAVARAERTARAQGLDRIRYAVVDLDRDPLPGAGYDLVVAHAVLHHVSRLEDLYRRLAMAMHPGAWLLANEYVGPRRFQFPDAQTAVIERVFDLLAERHRISGTTGEVLQSKPCPAEADVIAADPSEAVRSDEVLPRLADRFTLVERRDYGGALLQHLLWDIAPAFDSRDPRDARVLALLCLLEHALEHHGELASDYTFVAARNQAPPAGTPRPAAPPAPPRAVPIWLLAAYLAGEPIAAAPPPASGLAGEIAALLTGGAATETDPGLEQNLDVVITAASPALEPADSRDRCTRTLVGELERLLRRSP